MLIKTGLLIDGTGRSPDKEKYIEIERDKIKSIGKKADYSVSQIASALDFSGFTLLPGLIDCHVHLFLEGIADFSIRSKRWKEPKEITLLRGVKNIEQSLKQGITTVRDLGGPHEISIILKQAVDSNIVLGPRIITSNRAISITGGHFHYAGGREADGADDIVKAVREQIKAGAEWIKVMLTGSVNFTTQTAGCVEFSDNECRTLFSEARRLNKPVVVHANGKEGIKQALELGATTLEHAALLDEVTVEAISRKGIFWTPTLLPFKKMLDYSQDHFYPNLPHEGIAPVYNNHYKMVQLGTKLGAKLIAGTDAGSLGVEHGNLYQELQLFVELGMTNHQAIHTATGLAAAALGLDNLIGTLTAGKFADIIAVKGDPTADISCLKNVAAVFREGHEVFCNYSIRSED